MKTPKELSTVTPTSKVLSAIMFIMLPILGFIIGSKYGFLLKPSDQLPIQTTLITNKQNNNDLSKETPIISQLINSPTPINSGMNNMIMKSINLYELSVMIPTDWTIKEINRRPEPTEFPGGVGMKKKGHDCAEYSISSDDTYAYLLLKPTCGWSDGGGEAWPNDSVIVRDLGNNRFIIRYFDSKQSVYIYSIAASGVSGNGYTQRTQAGALSLGDNTNYVYINNEFRYSGPAEQKNRYLAIGDAIVSSLKKN